MKAVLSTNQKAVAGVGAVLVLVSFWFLWIAVSPFFGLASLFDDPSTASNETLGDVNSDIDHAKLPGGVGLGLMLVGAVMIQWGMTRKEVPVEDVVRREVADRLGVCVSCDTSLVEGACPSCEPM